MTRLVALFLGITSLAGILAAERRALLIAAPRVLERPEIPALEGPENDVASLRRILVQQWGFRDDLVRTVSGSDSTRRGILEALDRLADATTDGDHVLVYFSGHGVSAHDLSTRGYGMRPDTGAIVPADLKPGLPTDTLAGLIIGSRDLRPRFERFERVGAETLVLFDACYSGDSAKSPPRLVPRSAQLFPRGTDAERAFDEEFARLLAATESAPRWPYDRVIYISASARHELAWDIPYSKARGERPTIDGLAHGAFTNGLLLALRGNADRDRDGQIVYSELQEYLVGSVVRDGQTPQLRPTKRPIVERPLFGQLSVPERPEQTEARSELRVRLDLADAELKALLEGADGIAVTPGEYDLEVRRQPGRFQVYLPSGAQLGLQLRDAEALIDLLQRRARAQRFANLAYPRQDMRLELVLEPEQGGVYYRDDYLSVGIRPSEAAWLLLLAIDPAGSVTAIYPYEASPARRAEGGETVRAVKLAAVPPFGTELLEAFAFREKPRGYDSWAGAGESLRDQDAEALYEALRAGADADGRGRASRIVYTVER